MANFIHDLVLRTYFRVMGYAHVVAPTSPPEAREAVTQAGNEVRAAAPGTVEDLIEIRGASALRSETDIVLLRGGLPFTGYVNRHGAVLETADALYALYIEALKLGVSFTFKEEVDALWWDEHGRCTGVVSSKHSRVHTADAVIVAAGASIPGIVPAAAGQLTPTAYVTAHIELTSEELWCLQGIPVLHVPDLGYLTSPDKQTHLLQVCVTSWEWEYAGRDGRLTVLGRADVLPPPAEERMRKLLHVTLPWLEHRELVYPRMVWTTRTTDGHFLMDKVPGTENVYVAVGDMDKSIGLLPLLGREVTDMVLRGEQKRPLWRWKGQDRARPLGKEGFDYDAYFGGEGSLRERERKANARRGVRGSYSPKRAFEFRIEDQLVIEPGMMRCSDLHPSKRRKYPTTTMPPQFLWRKTKSKAKSASKQCSA
jgi:glycine/D-amino acid oxidase-like deaminating enzyme